MAIGLRKTVSTLESGDTIAVTHPNSFKGNEHEAHHLVRSGQRIRPESFAKLRERLEPVGDGLFDGCTQTWRLKA